MAKGFTVKAKAKEPEVEWDYEEIKERMKGKSQLYSAFLEVDVLLSF